MNVKTAADHLADLALLLELSDENQFKVRAVANAARILETQSGTVADFVANLATTPIRGFGQQIPEYLSQLAQGGTIAEAESIRKNYPETMFELFKVSGLGVKKVKALYEKLGIATLEELIAACESGAVADLKGFGAKTAANISAGAKRCIEFRKSIRLDAALRESKPIIELIAKIEGVEKIELTGDVRRGTEIVHGFRAVAVVSNPKAFEKEFLTLPLFAQASRPGATEFEAITEIGLPFALTLVDAKAFGSEMLKSTGSEAHLALLDAQAKASGFDFDNQLFATESDAFAALELAEIPPEAREGGPEVELAQAAYRNGELLGPLVELSDIQGIVHVHTTYSDGKQTLREMAEAAKAKGFLYLGVTDHSQTAAYAGGLREADINRQHDEIDQLNDELAPFHIFKGIESDILPDGSLDYPERVLEKFDFIIASLHGQLSMARADMTARLLRAVENPYTTIIGHPSTRRLLERDAADIDMEALLEHAAKYKVAIEVNASPKRLDLDWRYHQRAAKMGIPIPICPDAHSIAGMDDIQYGVIAARKGLLTAENIPTTWDTERIAEFFAARRSR